jgi:O-antigen ligase
MTHRTGFLHWIFPLMLGFVGFSILLSNRDLSLSYLDLEVTAEVARPAVVAWVQRLVSLLLVAIAAERVFSHLMGRKHLPSPLLALMFMAFWLGTVAFPAVFGAHPNLAHEYLYTLAIGIAAVLAGPRDFDKALIASRNTLFVFLLLGLLLIPLKPALVLETTYSQGLLSGLPRFAGLAPHAVTMGMFALIALLCLWCKPFGSRWLTRLAWMLGGAALLFAQSKNAWIAFFLCSLCMLAVRNGPGLWHRMGDPRQGALGVLVCMVVIAGVLGVTGVLLLSDVGEEAAGFFATSEGAQLLTMTGRDRIWVVAMEEWRMSPVFGYGPELWSPEFRASIGILNATSGHNQFVDTLARNGTVGATALVLYAAVLLFLSLKYAKATGGFSLALFVVLALRSITEVPLLLYGYGTEVFSHLLLVVTLASAAAGQTQVLPAVRTSAYYDRVVS